MTTLTFWSILFCRFGKGFFVPVRGDIANIRQEHERKFEQNQRFEEMTDLAERVGFPINTDIYYELRGESLYATTDTKSRAFIEQTCQAKQEARYMFTGDQSFEVTRRSHEHDEAIDAERLAKGELSGNVMVKVSKVPDAIVEGTTSIKGYKRDTKRTFVRIYHREGPRVRCRLFSIDHNDTDGLNRIGSLVGMQLTGRSSEDILADKIVFDITDAESFVDELAESAIASYDDAMYRRTGQITRGGSSYANRIDAQTAVESQPHLLKQHFAAISAIVGLGLNKAATEDLLETERQRTAAAISLATRGEDVVSTGDASVLAEAAKGDYSRECATATENAMQQGENELTKDWVKEVVSCPICGETKVMARKHGEVITGSCGCNLNVCTGEYWKNKPQEQSTLPEKNAEIPKNEKRIDKNLLIKRLYGEKAVLSTRGTIGGVYYDITDMDTGAEIDLRIDLSKILDLAA
ncbi:MAG: hypothetical protein ABIQ64_04070 [Candidatus Saccharimonadales bacterium]